MTQAPAQPAALATEDGALLQALLTAELGQAIIAVDRDGRIRHCNPLARRLLEPLAGPLAGRLLAEIHAELGVDPRRYLAAAEKAIADGSYRFRQKIETAAGTVHLDSCMLPLYAAPLQLAGFALVSRDCTELVQADDIRRKLSRAVEQSPVAIIITDTEGRVEYVNARYSEVTGYRPEEVIGSKVGLQKSGLTPPETYVDLWQTIRRGEDWRGELCNRRKDGRLYWDSVHIVPIVDERGAVSHYLSIQEDISARKQSEETIRLWATVFENSGEAVMITDTDNRIISVNQAFTHITGYAPGEVIGQNPSMLGSGRHDAAFFADMWHRLNAGGHWQGEIWDRRKSGEVYPKWLGISAVRDDHDRLTHYVAVFSDISERKAAQERIEYLARHDPLTGLPNRTTLADRMEQALAYAERAGSQVALLFLDLDRFKTINDSLGHPVGDALLQELTRRLKAAVRETDTISRLGGDEFVVLVGDLADANTAAEIAGKILDLAQRPFVLDGRTLSTSISVGITLFPDDGRDFETLLKKADIAMYHAKDAGRNTYRFFTEQMNAHALERLLIQNHLQQAIARNEFVLHYQPQVALDTGRIIGAEALVRWRNPDLGMVPPDRFIPMAEENGAIVAIGDWVLREACRQAKAWRDEGLDAIPVAVNISALQLKHGDFVERVLRILADTGHDPAMLELEFTESILIQDIERVLGQVRRLKAHGITVAIDDFGTGYSSLSYLKRLDVDRLKIDRSFIRDIGSDPDDAAIVRAVTQMARSLRLKILAEGAETAEQTRFLLAEGCREVQGFLYSRPLAAEAFAKLYRESGGLLSRPPQFPR
ncbi:EAL domain-containing protein [Azospira restricta]|uniref:EAL domain-containing protein n=1 Tax=Azospira restricta TaxID=404405 RepID=A0A974PX93_9RHOO|nr:EAL domain-containing protein [Azospira restricta]QRJ63016.1 EAL domain-containing protein [Azospira restricta]